MKNKIITTIIIFMIALLLINIPISQAAYIREARRSEVHQLHQVVAQVGSSSSGGSGRKLIRRRHHNCRTFRWLKFKRCF